MADDRNRPTAFGGFTAVLRKETTQLSHDFRLVVLLVIAPLILIVFLSKALGAANQLADPTASDPYEQTLPGFYSMFAFFAVAFTAHTFIRESLWGTWDRLLSLPIPRWAVVAAKGVSIIGIVTVQGTVLVLGGALLFDVDVTNPLILLGGSVLVGCVACAVGLLLTSIARSEMQAQQLTNLMVLASATIGGAIAPVGALPSWVQNVSPASPHYWAVDLLKAGLGGYKSAGRLALDASVLAAMAVGIAVFATHRMPWSRLRRMALA